MDSLGLSGIEALRALKNDSKKVIREAQAQQARTVSDLPPPGTPGISNEDPEKRKEQLRIGKLFFEFNQEEGSRDRNEDKNKDLSFLKGRGRPRKEESEKTKNVTISLSKDERVQLDGLNSLGKGRGSKVVGLMNYYVKHERRQKDQARAIKEALRVVGIHIDKYARNYKRADRFTENEQTLEDLDRSIQNLRIVLNVLKFDTSDLKVHLTPQEFSNYEFALSFASNRKGDQ